MRLRRARKVPVMIRQMNAQDAAGYNMVSAPLAP
jgi:hypothetical protein